LERSKNRRVRYSGFIAFACSGIWKSFPGR
jgi:hypothetical protein